jgi:hypothetical protein
MNLPGRIDAVPLYLFHYVNSAIFALANEQTGSSVRKDNPHNAWLLLGEVARSEVPPAILVAIDQAGYCLLDEDEIRSTRSRWLLRQTATSVGDSLV